MSKKKIAVIGLGSIGSRHARNLMQLGHEICGFDTHTIAVVPGMRCYHIWENLPGVDAYVIASPTPTHAYYIAACELFDKPYFVEKPLRDKALDSAQGAQATMVGYNLRFHSCVLQAKEWIDSGLIGKPQWANLVVAQRNDKTDYLRDGVILNWSHEIDLALHLLGPATVKACVADEKETLADIILVHENGCQTTLHLDYLTRPEIRQSVIVGDKGTIIIDLVHRHAWLRHSHEATPVGFVGDDSFDSNYIDEMESFIARIDGQETVGCTGAEGLEALKICLEAKRLAKA
jgi:predicted dehydrogenase